MIGMQYEIGDEFEINGDIFKVIKETDICHPCSICDLDSNEELCNTFICSRTVREDRTDVMFILIDSTKG